MKARYVQRGEALNFLNSTETVIGYGEIVAIGNRMGGAGCDIPAGAVGTVHMTGVFELPKGAEAVAVGADLYLNGEGVTGTAPKEGAVAIGYAAAAAAQGDGFVPVKLLG